MLYQPNDDYARRRADGLYGQLYRRGCSGKLWSALTRKPSNRLLSLHEVQQKMNLHAQSDGGIQLVPVEKIHGSDGRCQDFDAKFRPLQSHSRERWLNVAMAHHKEVGLPAVELVAVNDVYYVIDGHHRISVANAIGQRDVDAHVTVWKATPKAADEASATESASATPRPRKSLTKGLRKQAGQLLINIGTQLQTHFPAESGNPVLQGS